MRAVGAAAAAAMAAALTVAGGASAEDRFAMTLDGFGAAPATTALATRVEADTDEVIALSRAGQAPAVTVGADLGLAMTPTGSVDWARTAEIERAEARVRKRRLEGRYAALSLR